MPNVPSVHSDPYSDSHHLVKTAYAGDTQLAARHDIYRYQQPAFDFVERSLSYVNWSHHMRVVDIGCGTGRYLQALVCQGLAPDQLLGIDLSLGMIMGLRRRWAASPTPPLTIADVRSLPLPDKSCDVALAMHMLYHVPDIHQAINEIQRVLRPGGALLAATNSCTDKREMLAAYEMAVERVANGARSQPLPWPFSLENGQEVLQRCFTRVERHDSIGALIVPDTAPVLRFLDSNRATMEPRLPAGVAWEAVLSEMSRIIDARIAQHGAFSIRVHRGVFVCR